MILQLNPTIPIVTPKGKGYAHLVIDYYAAIERFYEAVGWKLRKPSENLMVELETCLENKL